MSVEQMRDAIAGVYSGDDWKRRVSRMPEDQVMAIYFRFQAKDYINNPPHKQLKKYISPSLYIPHEEPVQLTIDDLLAGRC